MLNNTFWLDYSQQPSFYRMPALSVGKVHIWNISTIESITQYHLFIVLRKSYQRLKYFIPYFIICDTQEFWMAPYLCLRIYSWLILSESICKGKFSRFDVWMMDRRYTGGKLIENLFLTQGAAEPQNLFWGCWLWVLCHCQFFRYFRAQKIMYQ